MPESDLDLLVSAALHAGDIARGFWKQDPEVWDKGVDGPVSEADFAVDAYLKERLLGARPDYGWLSEETEDKASGRTAERLFIADPIDGTRAFIEGEPTWAHSIAVVEDGVPVAGVVYLPVRQKLYAAATGEGATLNGNRIRASNRSEVAGGKVLANRVTFEPEHWRGPVPGIDRAFRPSLAYRMCLVADGSFDAMLTLRPTWEWDIAAGSVIVAEAQGVVSDRSGTRLRFGVEGNRQNGILAAGPAFHRALIERLH